MNAGTTTKVLLLVPCFNEASRLQVDQFTAPPNIDLTLLFCDDGSSDGTTEFLKRSFRGNLKVLVHREDQNSGKAGVIRKGMLWAKKNLSLESFEWIGFWDADLATPLDQLPRMLAMHRLDNSSAGCIIGSRVKLAGSQIVRRPLRHYLGRIFVTLADFLLDLKVYDSQCGAKLFRPSLIDKAFSEEFLTKWIFDLEVILRIGREQVYEAPLQKWEDVPGSKVKIMRESLRVLSDLWKLRSRYPRGR